MAHFNNKWEAKLPYISESGNSSSSSSFWEFVKKIKNRITNEIEEIAINRDALSVPPSKILRWSLAPFRLMEDGDRCDAAKDT
jgi:hypothetical protein